MQARPAASHHREAYYMGTTGRRMLQEDGPPGTVPEHVDISDTESDAAMTPMSAMSERLTSKADIGLLISHADGALSSLLPAIVMVEDDILCGMLLLWECFACSLASGLQTCITWRSLQAIARPSFHALAQGCCAGLAVTGPSSMSRETPQGERFRALTKYACLCSGHAAAWPPAAGHAHADAHAHACRPAPGAPHGGT